MDQHQYCFNPHRVQSMHQEGAPHHRMDFEPYQPQTNAFARSSLTILSPTPWSEPRPLVPPPTPPAHLNRVTNPSPTLPLSRVWHSQTPDSVRNRPKKTGRTKDSPRLPKRQYRVFFQKVPDTEDGWLGARKRLGLTNLEGIAKAIDDILWFGSDCGESCIPRDMTDYITHRAGKAESIGGPDRVTSLSRYSHVVFLGECCVARQLEMRTELIDEAIKQFLHNTLSPARSSERTGAGSKTQRMYENVPVWITRQEESLFRHRGHLASEMFLHGAMSLSNFDSLSRSGPDHRFRKETMAKIPSNMISSLETELPFYLPFIVWARIRLHTGIDCYEQLGPALGVTKFTPDDFQRWFKIYQQNTTKPTTGNKRPLSEVQSEPTGKRQRTSLQRPDRSPLDTAASGVSGALAQAGDSAPSLLIGSSADKSVLEQGLQSNRLPQMPTNVGADQFTPSFTLEFGCETAFHGSQLEKPAGYMHDLTGPVDQLSAELENITAPFIGSRYDVAGATIPSESFWSGIDWNQISRLEPAYHEDRVRYMSGH
ncbi:hypothetical protein HER10_EVM0010508 [Colletotrichum scovillei]|uniref:uncharacterized protein n=1 Tax=Colletotrichum scovillei TaxID=1209932 RepID=UPI0015C3A8FB|nr:uncharacterized protein HER10_EVM0010508 [Colletotrichum scovillei]KAF4772747.1 hypothetical protein HER10_EVM0010508 [Colletotrichum scovillei]KAG7038413.1 hypothetical protein JMJ78_0000949 [Colletotrichum scovillei]